MDIGGKSLNFLDLAISIEGNSLVTSVYSKPTDAHLYLDAKSCHPKSQILGIAKSVALRVRRICSDEDDFHKKSAEYANYLIACGHDSQHVMSKFNEVATMTRQEARKNKNKGNKNRCIFAIKYNPRGPDIRKILKRHYKDVIANDEKAVEILPEGAICVAYKRNANLKELLAPSNPFKRRLSTEPTGCFKCKAKRCDCCQNFLEEGSTFISESSGRVFQIGKFLTCTSDKVVYLARCVACGLQGVGSTINFKTRLANYKSHIKHNRRTCGIVNHFLDNHNADHSLLKFMLIDQRHGNLRECENFWIGMLLTNQRGLNFTHDYVQQ